MSDTPQSRFAALGLALPPTAPPAGLYKPCLVVGSQALVSGHLPLQPDGSLVRGRVGADLDADAGKEAARRAGMVTLRDAGLAQVYTGVTTAEEVIRETILEA